MEETTQETTEVVEESTETKVEDSVEETVETENAEEEIEIETVEEETPVEEVIEEEAVEEEVPVEEDLVEEEIPQEAPVEEVPVEDSVEEVPVETPVEEEVIQEAVISQALSTIKVSDFKFLGYSINENHYQEWKTALGYTGNAELINDVNLGTHIYCSSDEYNTRVALGDPYENNNIIAAYHWITSNEFAFDGGYNSKFTISFKYKRLPVYDGPIVYGMTFDEVKQIVGYNDALSVENGTYRMCTLNDGSNVLIDAVGHNEIIVEGPKFEINLWFFNDVIEYMSISFPL